MKLLLDVELHTGLKVVGCNGVVPVAVAALTKHAAASDSHIGAE